MTFEKALTAKPEFSGVSGSIAGETGANAANGLGDVGEARVLTIPVKGIYFDQIISGEKREEYRLVTSYWIKRLRNRVYDRIVLTRGYPKGGGVEGITRLTRQYSGYSRRIITHPHFGPDPVEVYAIDVSTPTPEQSS